MVLVHGSNNLIQRPVTLLLNESKYLLSIILQRRLAPAVWLGLQSPFVPPRLMPANRSGNTDAEAFCRLGSCRPFLNGLNNTLPQIR
jgi:hypothetical protein